MRYYGVQNEVKSYLNRLQSEDGIEVSLGTVKTLNDRVEALKKSGVWSQYGLGFNDRDADRYFQRATVRDAIGRFEVCLFVRGMKTLGLWQNMVSWPMRSYQNAGTGSTVYSLGGLGVYDGSMINSPTWGTDGITFNNSSAQSVSTTLVYNPAQLATGFATIVRPTDSYPASNFREICGNRSTSGATWFSKESSGAQAISLFDSAGDHNYGAGNSRISTTFSNTWHFAGGFVSSLSRQFFNQINATTATASTSLGTISSGNNTFYMAQGGDYGTTRTWTGQISIATLLRREIITSSNIESIRQLLKLTLGSNLGLP